MNAKEKINILRQEIDKLDDQILKLLVNRFQISAKIGDVKSSEELLVGDPNREREIIDRLAHQFERDFNREDIASIFSPVYQISKNIQKKRK
ncbi:MAG: chorismate mutase [Candidatus Marinimicrobia bacterium]|jgi:chorismate mutase|nr:chorismate mutase [Candidatus Neomarinimicrobiota bacterium]MBT3496394.1 chorismate mutase [Candidatus Neomarinimicrobiota bacterium]MBT3692633.1 chorismate mutase [Candidatus Neomarinimicrobiota bacterium]MBT3731567.1 chorismate mutase [Candidatus Neomarinimicrobiota bacterium]MBT4145135.1 chorismate mutase [Candidatus Neomarinimicrobiota bacterium]